MIVSPASRDPLILRDELHYTMMEKGSVTLVRAIRAQRQGWPAFIRRGDVMWLERRPSGGNSPRDYAPEIIVRQHRDPCPKCAVRADIGCRHRRVA